MTFEHLAYVLSQDEEISNHSSLNRSLPREVEDPFHLNTTEFRSLHRLSPDLVEKIVSQLDSELKDRRITALSTEKQVFLTLRLFETACYQRLVDMLWRIYIRQSSVSHCILAQFMETLLGLSIGLNVNHYGCVILIFLSVNAKHPGARLH